MKDKASLDNFTNNPGFKNENTDLKTKELEKNNLTSRFEKNKASDDEAGNSSVLRVLFKNESFAKKYKVKIEKFLKELLEEGEEFIVSHPTPTHNTSEQEFEDNHQTFQIDKSDNGSLDNSNALQNVPVYSTTYEDTLNCAKDKTADKTEEEKPSLFTCFNCLGNHHMKECPEKLDRTRINANKKEILMGNTIRYHTDDQNNGFIPGSLSDKLREALGLKGNQLPQFIYHMRVVGYPPGWMNEAVFESSGLSLFDSNGKAVNDDVSSSSKVGTLYDAAKFIDYPGFNTPVPKGFLDEWKELSMPSLQPHQQLTEALKSPNLINSNNLYKRKQKLDNDADSKKQKNVAAQGSSSFSNGNITENGPSSPQPRGRDIDIGFQTPNSKPNNKRQSMSLSMSPGTPVLEQGNPYHKLPAADKFAEGITEHLPFENLPDAVGSFEKMRGVISCVQKKLNDIKQS